MLDFPAAAAALWAITAATGVKPEHLLPPLFLESGFDPSIPNAAGQPFYGINQASTQLISTYAGVDPQTYLTWPASQQLSTVVKGMIADIVHRYGPIRSATRMYQANFLPATLPTARQLSDVLTSPPSPFYNANSGLDANHDGAITLGDLAVKMTQMAHRPQVQQAIRDTYAARDGATASASAAASPTDINEIVYGDDFSFMQQNPTLRNALVVAGILAVGGGVIYAIETRRLDRFILPKRNRRRR
jgi:hypothetical protein